MLDQGNSGLKHVRNLILRVVDEFDGDGNEVDDYPDAALLIYSLPKNVLQTFEELTQIRWDSWNAMPSKIYQTLFMRQRTLTCVELNASDVSIDALVGQNAFSLLPPLKNIDRLRIMPGTMEPAPEIARQILQESHNLRRLDLEFQHMAKDDSTSNDLHAQHTSRGAIQTLFKGLQPATVGLRNLVLICVNLQSSRALVLALNLPMLEGLQMFKCYHVEDFLKTIVGGKNNSPANLRRFEIYHGQAYRSEQSSSATTREPDPLLAAINALLASSPLLHNLWICLRGLDELPELTNIIRHGSTLRGLFLDVRKFKGPSVILYPLPDWKALCGSLQNIHQLDMNYPVAKADLNIHNHRAFCDYIKATSTIATLRTLGFNNWPEPIGGCSEGNNYFDTSVFNEQLYRETLAVLATDIVTLRNIHSHELSCSDIKVIRFGLKERICDAGKWGFDLSPMDFVKSRVHIMGGEQKTRMEWATVKSWDWELGHERSDTDIDFLTRGWCQYEEEEE
ncbi:MAG: hypothetical protein Q9180_005154 [Flavoplaca navasiana]